MNKKTSRAGISSPDEFLVIFLYRLKLATSNLVKCMDVLSPIIKSHLKTKMDVTLVWGAPKNLRFPFNIVAMAEVAMVVSKKRY